MIDSIKYYIEKWNDFELKPKNEPDFLKPFTAWARIQKRDNWEFTGENGYCGYTASVCDGPYGFRSWNSNHDLEFEFAYGRGFVKVFTANHNGFWVPEYLDLRGEEASELLEILKNKALLWAGFEEE